jgi:hypothetical protein
VENEKYVQNLAEILELFQLTFKWFAIKDLCLVYEKCGGYSSRKRNIYKIMAFCGK